MSDTYNSAYLMDVVNPENAPKVLNTLIKYIKSSKVQFDTIICRGTSGLLAAPYVAMKMKKHLIIVRKSDGNHASVATEGYRNPQRYIIIDDFIATGNTVRIIIKTIEENFRNNNPKCVAIFCYRSCGDKFTLKRDLGFGPDVEIPCWSMYAESDYSKFTYTRPKVPAL